MSKLDCGLWLGTGGLHTESLVIQLHRVRFSCIALSAFGEHATADSIPVPGVETVRQGNPSIFSQLAYCSVTFFVFFSGVVTQYAYVVPLSHQRRRDREAGSMRQRFCHFRFGDVT